MRRPWQLIVIRAWPVDGHRIIRLTLSTGTAPARTAYVASGRAAAEQVHRWLEEAGAAGPPEPDFGGTDETAEAPADALPRAADGRETVARRSGDGPAPTVRAGGELR